MQDLWSGTEESSGGAMLASSAVGLVGEIGAVPGATVAKAWGLEFPATWEEVRRAFCASLLEVESAEVARRLLSFLPVREAVVHLSLLVVLLATLVVQMRWRRTGAAVLDLVGEWVAHLVAFWCLGGKYFAVFSLVKALVRRESCRATIAALVILAWEVAPNVSSLVCQESPAGFMLSGVNVLLQRFY